MLLVIRKVGDRLAGQPDYITSLRNIILKERRRLNVFVGRCERQIGKMSLEGRSIGVSKISLPGLVENPVSTISFFYGIRRYIPIPSP